MAGTPLSFYDEQGCASYGGYLFSIISGETGSQ